MWRERLELLRYEKTIPMFGPDHLTYLAIILIVGAAFLIYAKKKFNTEQADKVGRILGIVAIVHLFLEIPTMKLILGHSLASSLPLHLCNFGMIMVGILLISRKQWALELAYFWALCGASQSLLTPDLKYIFPHPMAITFFTAHTIEIVGLLYAVIVLKMRPHWDSIPRVFIKTLLLAAIIFPLNFLSPEMNYMFLKHPPLGGSLIDLLGPWPWYLLSLLGVALVLFVIAYLPYAIMDGIKARKQKLEARS